MADFYELGGGSNQKAWTEITLSSEQILAKSLAYIPIALQLSSNIEASSLLNDNFLEKWAATSWNWSLIGSVKVFGMILMKSNFVQSCFFFLPNLCLSKIPDINKGIRTDNVKQIIT